VSAQLREGQLRLCVLLVVAAASAALVAYDYYRTCYQAANAAEKAFLTCRKQAAQIQNVRARPVFAATEIAETEALTRLIREARETAAIEPQAVDLVSPQSPSRLGKSSYRQRSVAIDLRGLNLAQIARFVGALTDRTEGIWVSQLRLTPVRSDDDDQGQSEERWNVELVLTQINYSPTRL